MLRPQLICLCLILLLSSGCLKSTGKPKNKQSSVVYPTDYSENELHDELMEFVQIFNATVSGAAADIKDESDKRSERRRALLWELNILPIVQNSAFDDDLQEGYVELFAITVTMRQYFTEGDGSEIFGKHQGIAIDAAELLEGEIDEIGRRFLTDEQMTDLIGDIEALASKNPIRGKDISISRLQKSVSDVEDDSNFKWLISMPMAPFRLVNSTSGLMDSVADINETAQEITAVAANMPEQIRVQAELLLYDIEDRDTVIEVLEHVDALEEDVSRLTDSVDAMPEDIKDILRSSDNTLAEAKSLVVELESLTKEVNKVMTVVEPLLAGVADADNSSGGGAEITLPEVAELVKDAKESIIELNKLAVESRAIIESEGLRNTVETVEAISAKLDQVTKKSVDHIALRVVQILFLFFTLLIAYRLYFDSKKKD